MPNSLQILKKTELYRKPLPASRTGVLYNAFSYPTKISPESIALFISTHTNPGDHVLDVFGGSGTTGIAAKLCDVPTAQMKEKAVELGLKPKWGPRKATVYELSVLGALIADVMCNPPCPDEFENAAKKFLKQAGDKLSWIWECKDPKGNIGTIRHVIWTDFLVCPKCEHETSYWEAAVKFAPLGLNKEFKCAGCRSKLMIDDCLRAEESVFDRVLETETKRRKRRMARVYGVTGSKNWHREPTSEDIALFDKVSEQPLSPDIPTESIQWGDLYRSGYHAGMTHIHHFYNDRNLFVFGWMWSMIDEFPNELRAALRFLLLSYNSSHSTLMSRVVIKKNQKDLVLTGAQSGVLYISGLPVEKNILRGIAKKLGTIVKAFKCVQGSKSQVSIVNRSSESISLDSESVDYMFTDPPFGDYIPYAEINQINEAWLGKTTERKGEVIISKSQKKGLDDYKFLLSRVFSESSRVLKPEGLATVVFHSSKAEVWRALSHAYLSAGFSLKATSILDKVQSSFKQTVSKVIVKGDPLLLLEKVRRSNRETSSNNSTESTVLEDVIQTLSNAGSLKEKSPEWLYSRYVSLCMTRGEDVLIDARDFYELLDARLTK